MKKERDVTGMTIPADRIEVIDGLRCVAIVSVIAYHFYARFAPPNEVVNLYPYAPVTVFQYGKYGVHLFFCISGFVIFRSLRYSRNWGQFIINRYFRLLPAMVLCSVVTFFFVEFIDNGVQLPQFHTQTPLSFLFSLTFIHPEIWNWLLNRTDITFIDGVYWTLWIEIVFYAVSGAIYFLNPRKIVTNWLLIATIMQGVRIVSSPYFYQYWPAELEIFMREVYAITLWLGFHYWVYFSIGVVSSSLYLGCQVALADFAMMVLLILLEAYSIQTWGVRLFFIAIIVQFLFLVFRPRYVSWLTIPWISKIGLSSYPLYLLHENIGMLLLIKFATYKADEWVGLLFALVLIGALVLTGWLIFRYYELPLVRSFRLSVGKYRWLGKY